jgi:hypothetical protein
MKSQAFGVIVLLTFLSGTTVAAPASSSAAAGDAPAAGFSVKDVRGGYGFSIFGLAASAAAAGAGVFTADGNGKITAGQLTLNVNGVSCHSTFNGTVAINADGTGTLTLVLNQDAASLAKNCQSTVAHFSLALTEGGRQIIMAQQDAVDVGNGVAFKQ